MSISARNFVFEFDTTALVPQLDLNPFNRMSVSSALANGKINPTDLHRLHPEIGCQLSCGATRLTHG